MFVLFFVMCTCFLIVLLLFFSFFLFCVWFSIGSVTWTIFSRDQRIIYCMLATLDQRLIATLMLINSFSCFIYLFYVMIASIT